MRLNPDIYQQEQQRVARRFEEAVQLAEQAFMAEFASWCPTSPSGSAATTDGRAEGLPRLAPSPT